MLLYCEHTETSENVFWDTFAFVPRVRKKRGQDSVLIHYMSYPNPNPNPNLAFC